jgi:type II pantothenate kinase
LLDECFVLDGVIDNKAGMSEGTRIPIDVKAETIYPYILVNMGSGVSILRVDGENDYKRIGGQCNNRVTTV